MDHGPTIRPIPRPITRLRVENNRRPIIDAYPVHLAFSPTVPDEHAQLVQPIPAPSTAVVFFFFFLVVDRAGAFYGRTLRRRERVPRLCAQRRARRVGDGDDGVETLG